MDLARGHRTRKIALLAAAIGAAISLMPARAHAHSSSLFFHGTWASSVRGAVPIYAESNLSGVRLTRALAGAKTWDNLGESLDFVYKGTKNLSRKPCDPAVRGRN